jgi:hypothetical protein
MHKRSELFAGIDESVSADIERIRLGKVKAWPEASSKSSTLTV